MRAADLTYPQDVTSEFNLKPRVMRRFMNRINIARILHGVLAFTVLCAFAKADTPGPAPQFTAQTLNVGKSDAVVMPDERLIAQLGAYGALIGKSSNVAGTQTNPGAADSLQHLLGRTGQAIHSNTREGANQSPALSPNSRGAKVIDAPRTEATLPPKPNPKTIFIFVNGERLETANYTLDAGFLHLEQSGQQRAIALNTLDIKATLAVNRERGIELKIPQSRSEITIAF